MMNNVCVDYDFNIVEALKEKRYKDIAVRCPIFMYDKKYNKTMLIVGIKMVSNFIEPPEYYLIDNWCDGFRDKIEEGETLISELDLSDFEPSYPMTEKQKNALLKFRYSNTQLEYMCGKEAWKNLNIGIKATKNRRTFRNYDYYDTCWDILGDVPNM